MVVTRTLRKDVGEAQSVSCAENRIWCWTTSLDRAVVTCSGENWTWQKRLVCYEDYTISISLVDNILIQLCLDLKINLLIIS